MTRILRVAIEGISIIFSLLIFVSILCSWTSIQTWGLLFFFINFEIIIYVIFQKDRLNNGLSAKLLYFKISSLTAIAIFFTMGIIASIFFIFFMVIFINALLYNCHKFGLKRTLLITILAFSIICYFRIQICARYIDFLRPEYFSLLSKKDVVAYYERLGGILGRKDIFVVKTNQNPLVLRQKLSMFYKNDRARFPCYIKILHSKQNANGDKRKFTIKFSGNFLD